MIARGTKLYVMLDERRLSEAPDPGSSWTDTIIASTELDPGAELYLLTVAYTTGNSFGRDPDTRYECIDVYPTQEAAAEQARAIRAHYERAKGFRSRQEMSFDECHEVTIRLGSGESYPCQGPWLGHFERIEEIEVALVHFGPKAVLKF